MKTAGSFTIYKDDVIQAYYEMTGKRPTNLPNAFAKRIAERTIDSITDDLLRQIMHSIEAELEDGAKAEYEQRYDL